MYSPRLLVIESRPFQIRGLPVSLLKVMSHSEEENYSELNTIGELRATVSIQSDMNQDKSENMQPRKHFHRISSSNYIIQMEGKPRDYYEERDVQKLGDFPSGSGLHIHRNEQKISSANYLRDFIRRKNENQLEAGTQFIIFKLIRLCEELELLKMQLIEGLEASAQLQQPTDTSQKKFEELTKHYAGLQKRHEDLVGQALFLNSIPQDIIDSMSRLDNITLEIEDILKNYNKARLVLAVRVDQETILASHLTQQLSIQDERPAEQQLPPSSGTLANKQGSSKRTSKHFRQGDGTTTKITDVNQFNKWLVTNFENLLAGEPVDFKRLEGMDTLVPDSILPHIPEPRRQAILALMGRKTGCIFCLKLIEMNDTEEKRVIFPHLIISEPRKILRVAKGIKYCPMLLKLDLTNRLTVFKEIINEVCCKCLAYKPSEKPCRNCLSIMGKAYKRPETCKKCQVHLFLCRCTNKVEMTEKIQQNYIKKLEQLLKKPLKNEWIVGLPNSESVACQ